MYHGGNHYDRTYGGGLANMYANGVNLHADGLPNEPKHTHLSQLHYTIAQVSGDLVASDAQYKSAVALPWRNASGDWTNGTQQVAFVYGQTVFIESSAVVFVQTQYNGQVYDMPAGSVIILQNGKLLFNTSAVQPVNMKRVNTPVWDAPLEWQVWTEGAYGSSATAAWDAGMPVYKFPRAVEMLNVTRDLTDFCWYSTVVDVQSELSAATLTVDAASATSLLAFVNGQYVGECNDHSHQWLTTTWQCKLQLGNIESGRQQLALLAVSLGIENGMDADENPQTGHYKGLAINATVKLDTIDLSFATWTLRPYLTGEYLSLASAAGHSSVPWSADWQSATGTPLTWYYATFPEVQTPSSGGVYSVLLDMSGFTRGHAFVNGHDIGRYWLIPASDGQPTQSLYHIPPDWLTVGGDNTLTVLEEVGSVDPSGVRLYVSQLQQSMDEEEQQDRQTKAEVAQE